MSSSKEDKNEGNTLDTASQTSDPLDNMNLAIQILLHCQGSISSTSSDNTTDLWSDIISISSSSTDVIEAAEDSVRGDIIEAVEDLVPKTNENSTMNQLEQDEDYLWVVVVCSFCGEPICRCVEMAESQFS